MLSEKIRSVQATLGELAGHTDEEGRELVYMARQNLKALAEQVKQIEDNAVVEAA